MGFTTASKSLAKNVSNMLADMGIRVTQEKWKNAKYDTRQLISKLTDMGSHCFSLVSVIFSGSLVAAGEAVGLVFSGTKAHDAASLKVIVEEAGGVVMSIKGKEQRYDQDIEGLIVSNRVINKSLVALAKKLVVIK